MPMWYSAGTVAVTANSETVTGAGTTFSANARVGDAFRGPDGRWYEITNIASATVLSINPNYQGATASGQAYTIAPMQGYVKESADRLRQLVDQFGSQLAALQPWATSATPAAAREALGTNDAANLTAGLLNVDRIPATLTPDKAFRRGNILGTVSQSGGVPTGAIIERGSNANGSYVRLADGTQECWTYMTAVVAPGEVKGFAFTNAVGFVSEVPLSFASVSPEAFTLEMTWGMEAHSANGATIYVKNNNPEARNVAVFFRTIGRWF
jgi:hypothetical protein